ncbi:ABC transporter substrate-binding protein [Streptomyces radicis]|uniref:Sugar ABC transporter substrate-binding protein n=1 Tax=Streptomyces radicis TaxID=1750517 RepID=A0A3A9WIZ4_9ACTN|nr:sugar ABC transporter substrate-binding protein [Streptomyces radicis]RKN12582.1 sugar ABC transporter substrate-binding protein [Streptomyces radicis]RKN27654.1 sugar ABC transporter substrate-binding protein [Streptomyces radicis]
MTRSPSRRRLLGGAAAGAAALAAAGCGFTRGTGDGLVFGFHGDTHALGLYQRVGDLYRRRNPGVTIRYTYADSLGFFQRLPLMFRAGTAPDVIVAAESWISGLSQLGGWADLTPYLERDGLGEDTWVPGALTPARIGGETLCLPCLVYPKGIAYNLTLMRERGVPPPGESWTEDAFLETAAALGHEAAGGRVYGLHNGFGTAQPYDVPTVYGGLPFDPVARRMTATSPEVTRSLQLMSDLIHAHGAMPDAGSGQEQEVLNFTSGRFGLGLFAGYSLLPWTEQIGTNFEWGVAPYPDAWSGTYQNNNAAVFAGSSRKEEAWDFAKFLSTDPEAQAILGGNGTPALRGAAAAWSRSLEGPARDYPWEPMIDRMAGQIVAYQGGVFNKIWDMLGVAVQAVENENDPVDEALRRVQARGTELLRA